MLRVIGWVVIIWLVATFVIGPIVGSVYMNNVDPTDDGLTSEELQALIHPKLF